MPGRHANRSRGRSSAVAAAAGEKRTSSAAAGGTGMVVEASLTARRSSNTGEPLLSYFLSRSS